MKIEVPLVVSVELEEAIKSAVENVDLSCLGVDGDSVYEAESIEIDCVEKVEVSVLVTLDLERQTGKFASRSDVVEYITEELIGSIPDEVDVEVDEG